MSEPAVIYELRRFDFAAGDDGGWMAWQECSESEYLHFDGRRADVQVRVQPTSAARSPYDGGYAAELEARRAWNRRHPIQGGMSNDELRAAWDRKLPGVEPTDRDLSAFALGVEVGREIASAIEAPKG